MTPEWGPCRCPYLEVTVAVGLGLLSPELVGGQPQALPAPPLVLGMFISRCLRGSFAPGFAATGAVALKTDVLLSAWVSALWGD